MTKSSASRGRSGVFTAALVVAVIAVLYLAREILIPLAFAITLTLILTPAVNWLRIIGLGRVPATILVMLVSIAVAAGIGGIIFNELVGVASDLPSYQDNIHNKIQAMRMPFQGAFGRAAESVKALGKELSTDGTPASPPVGPVRRNAPVQPARPQPVQIVDQPDNEIEYLIELVKPVLAPAGILAIVLIFTTFLLIEQTDLRNRLFRLAGLSRLNLMTQALDDATQRVSRYLMLQLLVNAIFGVLCGTGLYFIGVPYALLWGSVAGIIRIVPYAGSLVAGALPFLLSLAVFDGWMKPALVFVLFATLEIVTGNLIEPWLYGMHTGISALALLLTTVFWTALWGPSGLILATPLTVCVVVLGRHVPQLGFLHILLGDQPVLAPEAQIYQRLLAMDDQEARAVAEAYLADSSLLQLYDSVIIPALTMAEHDRHQGALEPSREEFVFLSIKEMVAEFSEKAPEQHAASLENSSAAVCRILCLPASDEADEIAGAMLAQLLGQAGCIALSFPPDPSLDRVVAVVQPAEEDVFCISAVPPFAFTRARELSRLLQTRFPKTKIVIGVWGFTGDTDRAIERFRPAPPQRLLTNLASAAEYFTGVPTDSHTDRIAPV